VFLDYIICSIDCTISTSYGILDPRCQMCCSVIEVITSLGVANATRSVWLHSFHRVCRLQCFCIVVRTLHCPCDCQICVHDFVSLHFVSQRYVCMLHNYYVHCNCVQCCFFALCPHPIPSTRDLELWYSGPTYTS